MVLAEHQVVAQLVDVLAVAQQREIPGAVDGVAVHHAADQLVVLDDEFLVDAADGVGIQDRLGAFAADEIAGREQVDAGDLELGRGDRALVAADAVMRQVVGAHLGLLEQGRDQAVGDAAVRGAFADRIDARVEGLHRVVDDDAAVAVQAGRFGELGVGADADCHHDEVGGGTVAILEFYGGDAVSTSPLPNPSPACGRGA